jgi:hypothetical protein
MNSIPQEINSPTRIYKGLYVIDFAAVVLFCTAMSEFDQFINSYVVPFYYIFNVIIAFYFVRPSKSNLGRMKFYSFIYALTKDKRVYHTDYTIDPEDGSSPRLKGEA